MPNKSNRRPTLADVAKRSGMSKSAVSMILNDKPGSRLSAEAAERVKAAAEELGYRPNPAAQSLRLGKTDTIGFISDDVILTRQASGMIRGALDAAKEHGQTVLIAEASDGLATRQEAVQQMLDRRVDGIILGLMRARLVEVPRMPASVPFILANGATPDGLDGFLPDEYAAGYAMARLLVDAGHRRVGIAGNLVTAHDPDVSVTIPLRFDGILKAFEEGDVDWEMVDVDAWNATMGYDATRELMSGHPDLTAIVASNDEVAFGVYQALTELGLRIPTDVSVASFDDDVLATYHRPGLTTAHLPYEEMGRRAVEMILGLRPRGRELLEMPIVVRDSIAPPRPVPVETTGA